MPTRYAREGCAVATLQGRGAYERSVKTGLLRAHPSEWMYIVGDTTQVQSRIHETKEELSDADRRQHSDIACPTQ